MRDVYLTRRRGKLFHERRACSICIANDARPHGRPAFPAARRPRYWYHLAAAYQHPNPLRPNVIVWRCRKHARLRFVPLDAKQGLGGGVYR